MESEIKKLKKKLLTKSKQEKLPFKKGLSTGSTLLNLACSGRPSVGLLPGRYYLLVGDTNSGQSWFSNSILAEASINPNYDNYRLIYDDVEGGSLMDLRKYFGNKLADRMEPPDTEKDGSPIHSTVIEEFYYHVDNALREEKPFIYILDSVDSLSSTDEIKKFDQNKKAHYKTQNTEDGEEGPKIKGSYGDGKAKKNASNLRRLMGSLQSTGSILLIINQTHDNIGFDAMFNPKSRSGGHALEYYATVQMWSSILKKVKKNIRGKDRQIGLISKIHVKRTRITGKDRIVYVPIYHSVGIDDTGSCIDYLIEEKHWVQRKGQIETTEFCFSATREKLIAYIEENNKERELRLIVAEVWNDIEEACKVNRKNKYQEIPQ